MFEIGSRGGARGWRLGRNLVVIFVVAVLFNYLWELAQAPLYEGMERLRTVWWHCFVASLGDGLLVLLIFAAGWAIWQRQDWFAQPGVAGYTVMLVAGLGIGISVEWIARLLPKWATWSKREACRVCAPCAVEEGLYLWSWEDCFCSQQSLYSSR